MVLSVISLVLLYMAVAPEVATGRPGTPWALIFVPHLVLTALIVGGLRRAAVLLQTFVTLYAALLALGLLVESAMGHHELPGYGLAVALQFPLFVLCYRSAKAPFRYSDLPALGPRLLLGTFLGVVGWLGAGVAMHAAAAPVRARDKGVMDAKRREWDKREAYARATVLTACLQQSPVSDDSVPYFPATLAELPPARCPEAKLVAPTGFVIEYTAGDADSTGRHRTFQLSIHDSIPSDTLHAYDSDESMIVRSIQGRGNRRSPVGLPDPVGMLSRVGRCIEQARDTMSKPGTTSYPVSAIDARLRCEPRIGGDSSTFRARGSDVSYVVRYSPPPTKRTSSAPGGYTLLLEPARDSLGRGVGGSLISLYSDSAGLIHMTSRPRAATAADSVIPDCHQLDHTTRRTRCREYRPRQRWGLESELPTIVMSMSGTGTLGIGERFSLLPHFQPLLPKDLPAEVRVRWDSAGRDTVLARRRGVPFGTPIGNGVYFTFRHAWADTGMKRVGVRIRTVGGEEFESHQYIHVVPAH